MDPRPDDVVHCDADMLALIALGEPVAERGALTHLEGCDDCLRELGELRSTISVARSAVGEVALTEPPARVWQAIRGELGLDPALQPPILPARVSSVGSVASAPTPVVDLAAERQRRAGIRGTVAAVVASAAAAALITGAVLGWGAVAPRAAEQVLAAATLDALPEWPTAAGEATLSERADGQRVLRVAIDAAVDPDVVQEVWLLTPEVDGLISLGYLSGSSGEFLVPASVDLARFSVVDVSAERVDGDPTHSGNSIVRGALDV